MLNSKPWASKFNPANRGAQSSTFSPRLAAAKGTASTDLLNSLLGDSAEFHSKKIKEAQKKLKDLHGAIGSCALADHYTSLEKRLAFLEKELGESADKHDKHKTAIEDCMKFLEIKVGDSAERHSKEIEDAKAKLGKAFSQFAKQENHSSLEKRLAFLEEECRETFDKRDRHKTTMEQRIEFLEAKVGDFAEKHWKEIQATKAKLGDTQKAISQCAKQEHHSSLEKRLAFLENECGESFDKHDRHKTTMKDWMETLEAKVGDSAEKHWKEIQAAKEKLGDIHRVVSQTAKQDHTSSLDKRLGLLEHMVGDNIDKRLTSVEEKHMQDLIKRLNEYERKHMQEFEHMKGKVGDIDKALMECIEHYLGLDQKHRALSLKHAEIADVVSSPVKDVSGEIDAQKASLEHVAQRMGLLEGRLAEEHRSREGLKDMEQRLLCFVGEWSALLEKIRLEHSGVHSQAIQMKEQWDREMIARQAYQENYEELLEQERSARKVGETQVAHRFETFFTDLQRLSQEIQTAAQRPNVPCSVVNVMTPRMQTVHVAPLRTSIVTAPPTTVAYEASMASGTSTPVPTSPVPTRQASFVTREASFVTRRPSSVPGRNSQPHS